MKRNYLLIWSLLVAVLAAGQTELPMPLDFKSLYEKGTRSLDGHPGNLYWQNSGVYDIQVHFTPTTRLVSGTESIVYTNNSPDTLREIVFKLYPNIYKTGSPRLMTMSPPDVNSGVALENIAVNGVVQDAGRARVDGTNMVWPIQPLMPHESIQFELDFSYYLNEKSHMRTGQVEDGAYFIAYFFPRIAVYDDKDGWNRNPYLGTQEFYNDFCDFNVKITVPGGYGVWATGDLLNAPAVFTPEICRRLQQAEAEDNIMFVIDSSDLKRKQFVLPNPTNTFHFSAKNVTDFVFALSNHYLWQSSSLVVDRSTGRRTRVDAVFNPIHKDYYWVASDARKTVESMSFAFPKWPFPYAHETVFDGLDQMEYPMMVNDNPIEDRAESIELTDHEIFHTMFPFYMGINETKYGWMDEGWATIGEWLISPMIDPSLVDEYGVLGYEKVAGKELDMPVMTLTTQMNGAPMFLNSYPKPAMGYLFVKDLLGDDLFFKALHHYIKTWNGKHPLPYDFFYSMNSGAGQDLNWFWKAWFFDNGYPDLAIGDVASKGREKYIIIENKGTKPVPVDLLITYSDGTTESVHRRIDTWKNGEKRVKIPYNGSKSVQKLVLGSTYIPDVNKKDNVWGQ